MAKPREREPRQSVRLSVRYRAGGGWNDAQIRNLSSRGAMAVCASPPKRGSYVEFRRGDWILVGRVVWTGEDRFGLKTQDPVNLAAMTGSATPQAAFGRCDKPGAGKGQKSAVADPAELASASVRLSKRLQFLVLAAVLASAALGIAQMTASVVSSPLEEAGDALRPHLE